MSEVKTIICDICKRELPEYPAMRMTIYKDGKNESLDVCTVCEEAFKQFREHQRMTEIRNKNWKKKHEHIDKAEMRGKSCYTCKNSDAELSGECYECIKGIFDHYEAESEDEE